MKIAIIILGVLFVLGLISYFVGVGVKKKEKALMTEFRLANERISQRRKAYKGAKKKYGKVPKIIVKKK